MTKLVIFGNSGSGKSTLAKQYMKERALAHLDLDSIAWLPCSPPQRMPLEDSLVKIQEFMSKHSEWVIEGCYSDLLSEVSLFADELIYLKLPVSLCIENAKKRPWEPHKYESKEEQDKNLEMLIDWIAQYPNRTDTFSESAHQTLYDLFDGKKRILTSNR